MFGGWGRCPRGGTLFHGCRVRDGGGGAEITGGEESCRVESILESMDRWMDGLAEL